MEFTVELMDLVYDKTGIEFYYWAIFLVVLIVGALFFNFYKYKKHSHSDKDLFLKSKNYLEKVEEFKRKPLPLMVLLLLVFIVVIEAMGFAYVFSDYIIHDASSSDLRVAGVLGAILLASILVPLTHITGEQIYYNKKIDTLESYVNGNSSFKYDEIPHLGVKNTFNDNDTKSRAKFIAARIEPEIKKGKFIRKRWMPIATAILILAIAIGAYKVREETYLTKEKREAQKYEQKSATFNQDTSKLPAFLVNVSKQNADVQNRGIIESKRRSNLITYAILMFMFLGIQIIGVFSGMNWGFIGKESKQAYLNIKNYKKENDE